MKSLVIATWLFLFLALSLNAQQPWRINEMQVKIVTRNGITEAQHALDVIKTGNLKNLRINYEEANGFIRCYVTPDELSYLQLNKLEIEVEVNDLNALSASFKPRGIPPGYHTFAELNAIADSLATNFPLICTKYVLGYSSVFQPLVALKISDNSNVDENEPEIMFDGGIHGDEVGGPENMIRFARELCLSYGTDEGMTYAVNNAEIWIIYCINPYGRENMTRYNNNGVDINRDGGYMWNGEGNSPEICSQAETRVLRNMLRDHQMVMYMSYHSGTEFISYPWSYRETLSPDEDIHHYLSQQYSLNSGYVSLPYAPGFNGMYAINGSTKDFGYGTTGSIAWSIEISVSKQPPSSQIGAYYLKNRDAMLLMITHSINQGINGLVTDSLTGEPVSASIFIHNYYPLYTNPLVGDYHKFLNPGTYTMRVIANGYEPKEVNNIVIGTGSQTQVNVMLSKKGGYFAEKVVACQILNNNPADEGNTPALIGPPDSTAYSIGRNGLMIFDMGVPVLNKTGNDIRIIESDNTPEGYRLYAGNTTDGPWYLLGTGTATSSFDLSNSPLNKTRYFKITDDGDGSSQIANAGFDLDAVENLYPDTLTVGWVKGMVYVDSLTGSFTLPGAMVSVDSSSVTSNELAEYIIAVFPGEVEICGEQGVYWGCDTIRVTLGDTIVHDLHLLLHENVHIMDHDPDIKVTPNPAGDHFVLNGIQGDYWMQLYDIRGLLLDEQNITINGQGYAYKTGNLKSGLYFLYLKSPARTCLLKIIVN